MANTQTETAIFAGGCFWCLEHDLAQIDGVTEAVSGYTGGKTENPTYEDVSHKNTGHKESVKVTFDPKIISYAELLKRYWRNVDPFDDHGQFCDKGDSYKAVIFYGNAEQKAEAEASKVLVEKELGKKVVTEIVAASPFYRAEEYHQDYARKNPIRYKYYRYRCGRDQRLNEVWGREKSAE